jgi:hypothetical protein
MGPVRYIDCQLTFLNDQRAEYRDLEAEQYAMKEVPGKVGGDELGRRTVKKLNEWVQKYPEHCSRGELLLLGLQLYRIAFETPPDPPTSPLERPLKAAFEETFQRFRKAREMSPETTRMRIKLVFHKEAEELAGLPWEFLCRADSEDGSFLARETQLILTRFVPNQEPGWQTDDANQKLRILLVTAQPGNLDTIQNDKLIEEICKLKSENIDVKVFEDRATLDNLRRCISGKDQKPGYRPHIVHFMGHGRLGELAFLKEKSEFEAESLEARMRRQRGELSVKEPEESHWIDIDSVKSLFQNHKPRVVFLHACKGAAPDSLKVFSSTARELAYSNIPAVIAMQYEIGNTQAELFAMTFYQQLRQGNPVDEAVAYARRELGEQPGRLVWNDRSFGTPVIYLQTEKPVILPPPETKPTDESPGVGSGVTELKVPCPSPDCRGFVIPGQPRCMSCRQKIIKCPRCSVMMMASWNECVNGHPVDTIPSKEAAVGARSSFTSPTVSSRLIDPEMQRPETLNPRPPG